MSAVTRHLTAEIVSACVAAEASPSDDYTQAKQLVPAFSARHADSEDVSSVALVILASVLDDTGSASLAAGAAVKRASAWLAEDRRKDDATPIGDTFTVEPASEMARRIDYPAPDSIAQWTTKDTLAEVWERLDDTGRAYMAAMANADVWSQDDRNRSAKVNAQALGRILYKTTAKLTGRRFQALAANLAATLAALRHVGRNLPSEYLPTMAHGFDHERQPLRDTRIADSGPASLMVRTLPSGSWVTLADRSVRLSADAVSLVLSRCDQPAYVATQPSREEMKATLGQARTLRPLGKPAGIGAGITYGTTGQVANGHAYAESRPTVSRKRKRDGGIGSPMVTGGTRVGSGGASGGPSHGPALAPNVTVDQYLAACDRMTYVGDDTAGLSVAASGWRWANSASALSAATYPAKQDTAEVIDTLSPYVLAAGRCFPGRVRSDVATR